MKSQICYGSLSDVYSRKGFRACGKAAQYRVSLYGQALEGRSPYTPMCKECVDRSSKIWESLQVEAL